MHPLFRLLDSPRDAVDEEPASIQNAEAVLRAGKSVPPRQERQGFSMDVQEQALRASRSRAN
ncbi:MAG TPA: hypothetical protein VK968_15080 [Roseimicrobium sp.]|nr:hypothetical protein [Roseimicrobium sp.]